MGFGSRLKKLFESGKKEENDVKEVFDETIEADISESMENVDDDDNFISDELNKEPDENNDAAQNKNKNFKYLDDLIHSGVKEIILDSDIILDTKELSNYRNGIELDIDELVIDGNGHVIDACLNAQIFNCSGKNITIKNITLKNGHAEKGGAIFAKSSSVVTINESLLIENITNGKNNNGGAIFNDGVLIINESKLIKNASLRGAGGAIYNTNSAQLTISKSTFAENTAKEDGGAIVNNGKLNITDSTFNVNTAQRDGGALCNEGELTTFNSIFNKNSAHNGGALCNESELTIVKSTFTENTSINDGGALCNNGELTIRESSFSENTSIGDGGALYNHEEDYWKIKKLSTLCVMESSFTKNTSSGNGGALCNNGELSITNSILNQNTSENDGGALCNNKKGDSTVDGCSFGYNRANDEHSNDIYNNAKLTLKELYFDDDSESILNKHKCYLTSKGNKVKEKIHNLGKVFTPVLGNEKSFSYLNEMIRENLSEVQLTQDIKLNWGDEEENKFPDGIVIDKDDIVINGNGHIIDAQQRTRIFKVSGKNVTIKNVILKNGYGNDGGAIINYDGDLTIKNSILVENTSQDDGGAIYNKGELTIMELELSGNIAQENGGAIYNNGKLTISESSLYENTSQEAGGAIYNNGKLTIIESSLYANTSFGRGMFLGGESGGAIINCGELSIINSSLSDNVSKLFGGAIHNHSGTLTIEESSINANTAEKGGAIFNENNLIISGSTFNENTANGEYDGGGAIYNKVGTVSISNTTFNKNIANYEGGAIHNNGELTLTESVLSQNWAGYDGGAVFNNENLFLTKSTLKQNKAKHEGGAINNGLGGESSIMESDFTENIVQESGGAIYNYKKLKISNSTFNNNIAEEMVGGAILSSGELNIIESDFRRNSAQESGGAILSSGELNIIESNFSENVAQEWDGGALHNKGELNISNSTFNWNAAQRDGGALHNKGELNISDSNFNNNTAQIRGGAVYNCRISEISDSSFSKNTAKTSSGGAIYDSGDLKVFNSTFIDNRAKYAGAILTCDKSNIEDCIFNNNEPNDISKTKSFRYLDDLIHSGGNEIVLDFDIALDEDDDFTYKYGIELDIDNITIDGRGHSIDACGKTQIFHCTGDNVTIKNISLKNGFTEDYGGAIFNEGDLTIMQSYLNENVAKRGSGGAIYNMGKLTIAESLLNENTAEEGYGGAICNQDAMLTISNCAFKENIAKGAATIYGEANCELKIVKSTFAKNSSYSEGGTIINNGKLTIEESTFVRNLSHGNGGAIINNSELTISQSTIINNTSNGMDVNGGGAIFNGDGRTTITDSTLNENTAKNVGGAICNLSGTVLLTKVSLNKNAAENGGVAIHNYSEAKTHINESIIDKNNACNDNGVIINEGGEFIISDSTFNENIAEGKGGIICNEKGNFKVFDCKISNNNSCENIINNFDSLQVNNSNFIVNQAKYILNNESNLGISYGKFEDNDVDVSAIINRGKSCTVKKSIFKKNNSDNIINQSNLILISPRINDKGKTILNMGYILIKESHDCLNKIYGLGKVESDLLPDEEKFDFGYLDKEIHESSSNEIILNQDIAFETYEHDFYEGGILLDIDNLVIDGDGHTVDGGGKSRIFTVTGNNITIKNITFKNGQSYRNYDSPLNNNGGAIRINHNKNIIIENCKFINNSSEEKGGAIDNSGQLTITQSTFNKNMSVNSGTIYNDEKLIITDSTFKANISADNGGAIDNTGELTITKSIFNENNSSKNGGAIDNTGELTISHSSLCKNTAQIGGAINCKGNLSISDTIFNENISKIQGGAIFHQDDKISEMSAPKMLKISKSTFCKNASEKSGGAISAYESFLIIMESKFLQNTVKWNGGAINNEYGSLKILKSKFTKNNAYEEGGAIYNYGYLSASDSTFNENKSTNGGAIKFYNEISSNIIIEPELDNCVFTNNFPNDGLQNIKKDDEPPKTHENTEKKIDSTNHDSEEILSSFQGLICDIKVGVGDKIEKDTVLCVVEAMKVENEILSGKKGVVEEIFFDVGDFIDCDDVLLVIKIL